MMYCPTCGAEDWQLSKGPHIIECVHCGSVYRLVRKKKESLETRERLMKVRDPATVLPWKYLNRR